MDPDDPTIPTVLRELFKDAKVQQIEFITIEKDGTISDMSPGAAELLFQIYDMSAEIKDES